jgi:hypothetical protein
MHIAGLSETSLADRHPFQLLWCLCILFFLFMVNETKYLQNMFEHDHVETSRVTPTNLKYGFVVLV